METSNTKYRLIADSGELKTSELLNKCRRLFSVWSYYTDEQLDKDFPPVKSERKFLNTQEADEAWNNKSANNLAKLTDKQFITLRERLIFELDYFKETGSHLDVNNITLCAGSRYAVGYVPWVDWFDGGLCVDAFSASIVHGRLRAREAVSDTVESSSLVPLNNELPETLEINGVKYKRL